MIKPPTCLRNRDRYTFSSTMSYRWNMLGVFQRPSFITSVSETPARRRFRAPTRQSGARSVRGGFIDKKKGAAAPASGEPREP